MIEHALSAKYDLPPGAGMSIVMPAYLSMIAPMDSSGRLKRLSEKVFGTSERPADVLLRNFFTQLGLPSTLSQAGICMEQDALEQCADKAMPWGPMTVPGYEPFGLPQAKELLESVR